MMTLLPALLMPLVLATGEPAAKADTAAGAPGRNVSLTLVVGRIGGPPGAPERTYKMLGQDGAPMRMLMGWRMPIPTRSAAEGGEEPSSMSYVYQNVGVSAHLEARILVYGRVLVSGQVEISGARESRTSGTALGNAPLIGTFQQELRVVLREGKRLRVSEAPDPEAGTLYLDLEVDLLE